MPGASLAQMDPLLATEAAVAAARKDYISAVCSLAHSVCCDVQHMASIQPTSCAPHAASRTVQAESET